MMLVDDSRNQTVYNVFLQNLALRTTDAKPSRPMEGSVLPAPERGPYLSSREMGGLTKTIDAKL